MRGVRITVTFSPEEVDRIEQYRKKSLAPIPTSQAIRDLVVLGARAVDRQPPGQLFRNNRRITNK